MGSQNPNPAPQDGGTPNADNNEGDKGGSGKGAETFTQGQVNDIVSKRITEENAKAEQRLKDEVAKATAEIERRSKMSEEDRAKEIESKKQTELDERDRVITLRERRADAVEALAAKEISIELVDFVVDVDPNMMNKNIEKLETAFSKAVENGVKAKLSGKSPEDFATGSKRKETNKKPTGGVRAF